MPVSRRLPLRPVVVLAIPLLTLLGAGCGSGSAPGSSAEPRSAAAVAGLAVGVDVSEIPYAQSKGVAYTDTNGATADGLQIFRNHGYTWARIRVNIDPASADYALFTDLTYATRAAVAAKQRGFRILVDFHYSHWWADPANQWKPTTWSSDTTADAIRNHVSSWTRTAMTTLVNAGATPDMVQIGNEITNGLLWDLGGPYRTNGSWRNLTAFVNAGISAVKQVSGGTRILLHLDSGGSWSTTSYWISSFISNGGAWSSVDAMGFSYYPMWQGSLGNLEAVLSGMRSSYSSKEVWIAETAYYWTQSAAGNGGPYAQTPAGQRQFLYDLVALLGRYSNVKGVFYWGAGWAVTSRWLNAPGWSNDDASTRSLFDRSGRATIGIDGLFGAPSSSSSSSSSGGGSSSSSSSSSGGSSSGGSTPCSNPITVSGGQSGNLNTTGAVCLRTAATVQGWGCSNFDGRTVKVNGGTPSTSCGGGPLPLAKMADGYTYFAVSAGAYAWASLYYW
jgi:arabinogalactan endo-1,4-beta-galactosidase